MANAPIGINFLPTQDAADMGQQRGNMEGDLGEAIKILSLRAPRVVGARSITPGSNLSGGGSGSLAGLAGNIDTGGQSGGFNPNAALFQALISALMGGGVDKPTGGGEVGNPIFKYIVEGGPNPGSFDPITTENTDDPIYKKPETNWGSNGSDPLSYGGGTMPRQNPVKYMPETQQAYGSGDSFGY
jgi:hypothetical protein